MTSLELLRNRLGLLLLILIPSIFLAVVKWTSGQSDIPIKIFFRDHTEAMLISQYDVSLVFMSAAVCGFLTSYYAMILFHQNFPFFRYCIAMGMAPRVYMTARFGFFMVVVILLALFITLIMSTMSSFEHGFAILIGLILLGIIYGAYGGIVGLVCKDFMVGFLVVVLLANLDAGWLQNPVFYSSAQEIEIIRWLPSHFPCQFIFAGAFTDQINYWAGFKSLIYGVGLSALLMIAVYWKVRGVRRG